MLTRVKFCGITTIDDAREAVRLGVDAIGLVFAERSPRRLELAAARAIAATIPGSVMRVALFMDQPADAVRAVLAELPVETLQFHGGESPDYCAQFGVPYWKAVAMADAVDLAVVAQAHAAAAALLLDGHRAGEPGGGGRAFDWSKVGRHVRKPLILAGGLDEHNVAGAIERVRPYAVDVSSGIERAPGLKDHGRMQRFIDEVRRVSG
jgi:phosphoribosylanthranilate isomerase